MTTQKPIQSIALTIICAAVLAACGGGGGGNPLQINGTSIQDIQAANSVNKQIEALTNAEEVTASDEASITQALDSYNRLSATQKTSVSATNVSKLETLNTALQANKAAAKAVSDAINKLPAANQIDTTAEEAQLLQVDKAFKALSDNQKTWVSETAAQKLTNILDKTIIDNASLTPLNLPTPQHTSFISSSNPQQHNPHMQLRTIDSKPALVDTQLGIIKNLVKNTNDTVVIDGVVFTNSATDPATQIEYMTPHSAIAKGGSVGTSKFAIGELTGAEANSVTSVAKTTLDAEIKSDYTKLKAAQDALATALKSNDTEGISKAQAELNKIKPVYDQKLALRQNLESRVKTTLDGIAYNKKDKNGLVFDKAFDGVYTMQFADGTSLVLHDSAAAGWTYQTFAHYKDPKNGITHGYQSLGDETPAASMPTQGTATYRGITTAYVTNNGVGDKQLTANVTAVADFAKKGLLFTTNNAQFHTINSQGHRVSTQAANYNMRGTATWNANSNSFKGNVNTADKALSGTLNGKFYGADAAEIGGTYGLSGNNQQLIGGYGAKRD